MVIVDKRASGKDSEMGFVCLTENRPRGPRGPEGLNEGAICVTGTGTEADESAAKFHARHG